MSIVVGSELVPIVPTEAALEQATDPAQYVALACERAKAWLADALEHGEIEQIVELKSQAEAMRIYTQQKQLGKDAELSAAEIVRRAERGIGLAIRRGQEDGTIAKPGDIGGAGSPGVRGGVPGLARRQDLDRPADVAQVRDSSELTPLYAQATATDDEFEQAIEEAKAEENLSRANVVRKLKKEAPAPTKRPDVLRKTRHIDSNRVVAETVSALEGLSIGVGLIEAASLDPTKVEDWATSLSNSLRSLNRLHKQLKEMSRDQQ